MGIAGFSAASGAVGEIYNEDRPDRVSHRAAGHLNGDKVTIIWDGLPRVQRWNTRPPSTLAALWSAYRSVSSDLSRSVVRPERCSCQGPVAGHS
jgi:hypothetical protein